MSICGQQAFIETPSGNTIAVACASPPEHAGDHTDVCMGWRWADWDRHGWQLSRA